jgi:GNAT superfamily N-acetyltransferase
VRYVHANAFRTLVAPHVAPEAGDAFLAALGEADYIDRLRKSDLTGAWLDGELVATVGWRRTDDSAAVARIEGLFVRSLFTFMGIGSALLDYAESQARDAGCATFTATIPAVSAPFMLRLGYDIAAHGTDLPDAPFDEPMFLVRKRDDAGDRAPVGSGDSVDAADEDAQAATATVSRPRVLLFGK